MKRFLITDFEEEEAMDLFGLHSPIESYLLAFKLNQNLGSHFKNVTDYSQPPFFDRYVWSSTEEGPAWELISNHYILAKKEEHSTALFALETEEKKTLVNALSKVNYFLKVPQDGLEKDYLDCIQKMGEVQLIYAITDQRIKQNPNLIFD